MYNGSRLTKGEVMVDKLEKMQILFRKISFLQFKRNYKRIQQLGIYPGQQVILEIIKNNPGITNGLIASKTEREKATITTSLSRLEKNGLIIRKHSIDDKRVSMFYLTDKGENVTKSFSKLKKNETDFLFNVLDEKDVDNILVVLEKLVSRLQEKGGKDEEGI